MSHSRSSTLSYSTTFCTSPQTNGSKPSHLAANVSSKNVYVPRFPVLQTFYLECQYFSWWYCDATPRAGEHRPFVCSGGVAETLWGCFGHSGKPVYGAFFHTSPSTKGHLNNGQCCIFGQENHTENCGVTFVSALCLS